MGKKPPRAADYVPDPDTGSRCSSLSSDYELPVPPEGGFGWVIVAMSFLIHIIIDGVVYAFGVFLTDIMDEFQTGRGSAAWIASVLVGVTFFSGPLASAAISRFGCQVVCIVGSWVCGLAFSASYFAPNVPFLIGIIGVVGGLGMGMLYLPAIAIIGMYFEKRRALAIGLAVCGSGVGTFLFGVLGPALVSMYTWRGALLITGGLLINCAVFGALFRPLRPIRLQHKDLTEETGALLQEAPRETSEVPKRSAEEEEIASSSLASPPQTATVLCKSAPNINNSHVNELQPLRDGSKHVKSLTEFDKLRKHHHASTPKGTNPLLELQNPMSRKDALFPISLQAMPGYTTDRLAYVTSALSLRARSESLTTAGEKKGNFLTSFVSTIKEDFGGFSLLVQWGFVVFIFSNVLTSIGFNAPFLFTPDLAKDMGFSNERAGLLVSIMGATNTVGRISFGFICDKWHFKTNRNYVEGAAIACAGVFIAACPLYKTYTALALMAAAFGFFTSAFVTLTPLVAVDAIGRNDPDTFNKAYGITLLFQGIFTFVGAPIAGWLYDVFKSYSYSFLFTGSVIALSGVLLFAIRPVKRCQKRVQHKN